MFSSTQTLTIHASAMLTHGLTSKFRNVLSKERRTWINTIELTNPSFVVQKKSAQQKAAYKFVLDEWPAVLWLQHKQSTKKLATWLQNLSLSSRKKVAQKVYRHLLQAVPWWCPVQRRCASTLPSWSPLCGNFLWGTQRIQWTAVKP